MANNGHFGAHSEEGADIKIHNELQSVVSNKTRHESIAEHPYKVSLASSSSHLKVFQPPSCNYPHVFTRLLNEAQQFIPELTHHLLLMLLVFANLSSRTGYLGGSELGFWNDFGQGAQDTNSHTAGLKL